MAPILKLDPFEPSEEKELEFELDYQASLSMEERFEMLFKTSRIMVEQLLRHGHRKPVEIVKRA